jgi:cell division protein FtsB
MLNIKIQGLIIFRIFLLITLGLLQYSLWLGKNGIYDFMTIKYNFSKKEINYKALKIKNSKMITDIEDLNSGFEALEERARYECWMIKHYEYFYHFIPDRE